MKIINQTKGTVLAQDAILADTVFKRLKGLLGRKSLNPGEALVLKPANSIHTFFMRFAIDVLFVDRNNKVVKAIPGLNPGRLSAIYFQAAYVIELPSGTISSASTVSGDTITIL